MSAADSSWIIEAIDADRITAGTQLVQRQLLSDINGEQLTHLPDEPNEFLVEALQIAVADALDDLKPNFSEVRSLASQAFDLLRMLTPPRTSPEWLEHSLRTACHGILADRSPDVGRYLHSIEFAPIAPTGDWCEDVRDAVYRVWILLLRKRGWDDLDHVQESILGLRKAQTEFEGPFLSEAGDQSRASAWRLICIYHLAKSAEILAIYTTQGGIDGRYDIREQLQSHFDRSISACERAELVDLFAIVKLLSRVAEQLVSNSIWTVTRAVNSRVSRFVGQAVNRNRTNPIFEMLPPQRVALREQGLLGSSRRAVVVSLPTSSGKTMIAQFRILQALNQFDAEGGWVAYVAPTKSLVNQISSRLRRDFDELGVTVERVSPALEIDAVEEALLLEDSLDHFRVLVSTPEKLDLLLRGGWEAKIGRPLTLVVVDEAHNLTSGARGLRLELLLATINRECKNSQFLLLTPFVPNASELANWLSPDNSADISIGYDWTPNDRTVGIVKATRGNQRGDFCLDFESVSTTRRTIASSQEIRLCSGRPLGLTWSEARGPWNTAAAAAYAMSGRGAQIVVGPNIPSTWAIARTLSTAHPIESPTHADVALVQRFVSDEFGADFELVNLLGKGIGLHHSGLSDEARLLMEWLTENEKLKYLVATTTIAQGVNFPVSGVVMASVKYPYGIEMTPDEFWNLAGRAGRADQAKLGVIALAAGNDAQAGYLKEYIGRATENLSSCLIKMVADVLDVGDQIDLSALFYKKEWSSFLQYIAHSYRYTGNHEQFNSQIEQVLRGSFGFQAIRRSNLKAANALVSAVQRYSNLIRGRPLALVDSTGFCWESVSLALAGVKEAGITADVWDPETIFDEQNDALKRAFGVLFRVPELRDELADATSGRGRDSDLLARIVKDWVKGATVADLAREHFSFEDDDLSSSLTKVSQSVYGKLIQTASWGLSALQAITLDDKLGVFSDESKREVQNLPARIYYGVNSDTAIALRLAGVPRKAATTLSLSTSFRGDDSIASVRSKLSSDDGKIWNDVLGERGSEYRRIWGVLEGGSHGSRPTGPAKSQ